MKKSNNINLSTFPKKLLTVSASKILVVSDNSVNIDLFLNILSDFEQKICAINSLPSAMKLLKEEKFDIVIIGLDKDANLEIIKGLQESKLNFLSPFIVLNNDLDFYETGAIEVISPPIDNIQLINKTINILSLLKKREQMINEKESFLSIVVHDLKTPINSGKIILELLLSEKFGSLTSAQEEILKNMYSSASFMKELVENILCRNKILHNEINLLKSFNKLTDTISNAINLVQYLTKNKNQTVKFINEINNDIAYYDHLEIERVMMNLLSNASDYSPENTEITVKLFDDYDNFIISFSDQGNGIDIEQCQDLFENYVSYAKRYKKIGSGLGLYISKNIISLHNGKIEIKKNSECGTSFIIYLPKQT